MRTFVYQAILIVCFGITSCADDLQSSGAGGAAPSTTIAVPSTTSIASTTTTPIRSTSTKVVPTTWTTTEVPEPSLVQVDLNGPSATCDSSVELYSSARQGELFASVPGDAVLEVNSYGSDSAILTRCGDQLLVGQLVWADNESPFPKFVSVDGDQGSHLEWFRGDLFLVDREPFVSDDEMIVPLSNGTSLRLSFDRTDNLVTNTCGEHRLAFGLYRNDQDDERLPWLADNGEHLAPAWIEESIATAKGEFAIIEYLCTDDGSAARLILGSYNPSTGALIEFRRLEGFAFSSDNHRGPTGLSLDEAGEIVLHVGVMQPTQIPVADLCSNAVPLRPGGADWVLFQNGIVDFRQQLNLCEDGRLLASLDMNVEGTVFWAADVNDDGIEEVFVGGTASSSGGGSAWTIIDGQLREISDTDYRQLSLWDGDRYNQHADYGCIENSYAQIVARRKGLEETVTLTQFEVDDARFSTTATEAITLEGGTLFGADGVYNDVRLPFADRLENCT